MPVSPIEIAARVTERLFAAAKEGRITAINIDLIRIELAHELDVCPDDVATFDALEEITVRRIVETVDMTNANERERISRILVAGRCPDCDAANWRDGPHGGPSQNIECRGCLARFNVTRHQGQIVFGHRIETEAEGGATWDDARLAEINQIDTSTKLLAAEIGTAAAAALIGHSGPLKQETIKGIVSTIAYQLIFPFVISG